MGPIEVPVRRNAPAVAAGVVDLGQVAIKLGERVYRLSCGEGEEKRLEALGQYIDGKMRDLVAKHGQIGEERLVVMAALMITDELFDVLDDASDPSETSMTDDDEAGRAA
ncbi:MAG: cell division protein ZapA [Methyloceanibacter sp.]